MPRPDTLYEGDCLAVMRRWPDACVDHAIIDPPYGLARKHGLRWGFSSHVTVTAPWDRFSRTDYVQFSRAWLAEVCRVVKPNGNLLLFASFRSLLDLGQVLVEMDRRILGTITWFKPNAQPNITRRWLTESAEHVIWACNAPSERAKGWVFDYEAAKRLNDGKQLRNVWSIPITPLRERRCGKHPTQKPLTLLERLIAVSTLPGDVVLDCFAGTGTTAVAAQRLGRRWVLAERDAAYCRIARARLAA